MNQSNSNIAKWKRFEKLVGHIQRCLTPDAVVKVDDRIRGASGAVRQIDVSIRRNVGQFKILIVMDCKDWKEPVDIKAVEKFVGLVEDVGANKGAMVCNAGFTSSSKNKADQKGIDLFSAIDAESVDWPAYVALPTVIELICMNSYSFLFSGKTRIALPDGDPRLIEVFEESGTQIDKLGNLLMEAWNNGKMPSEPGEHRDLSIVDGEVYLKSADELQGPISITATIIIEKRLYFSQWQIAEAKGFKDEISGGFITNEFTTSSLDTTKIEDTWKRIESIEELAIKPLLILVMSNRYPLQFGGDSQHNQVS